MKTAFFAATTLLAAVTGCGGGADTRQEVIQKLRALGVASSPVISSWSDPVAAAPNEVELTLYAAMPLAQTVVTVAPYKDPRLTAPLTYAADDIVIDQSSLKLTPVGPLNLIEVKAKVKVPTMARALAAGALRPGSTGGQVNYGFKVNAGGEEELVTGTYMAYAPGSPELTWTAPTVEIIAPAANATIAAEKRATLSATVANANAEELKLGWFATGGEIQNRRAKETIWTTPVAGLHTLILTVRGKKSRGFSLKVLQIATQ